MRESGWLKVTFWLCTVVTALSVLAAILLFGALAGCSGSQCAGGILIMGPIVFGIPAFIGMIFAAILRASPRSPSTTPRGGASRVISRILRATLIGAGVYGLGQTALAFIPVVLTNRTAAYGFVAFGFPYGCAVYLGLRFDERSRAYVLASIFLCLIGGLAAHFGFGLLPVYISLAGAFLTASLLFLV